jgi:hypothetical protein
MKKSFIVEEKPAWRWWVTPKPLEEKPIHRWYVFPHSFTSELVHALIDEWGLGSHDCILDPFVGAGTTLLAAKEKGVPAAGYDLLPIAVLSSRAKVANYYPSRLEMVWQTLEKSLDPAQWNGTSRSYPILVQQALPGRLLGAFDAVANRIHQLQCSAAERDFFFLALIGLLPHYSHAIATGGWLKWAKKHTEVKNLPKDLHARVKFMLDDLHRTCLPRLALWQVGEADARQLPDKTATYSAVITSPPYPNRHDYTRVLGIELMFGFLNWEETRRLRYQSFHSHPEARPDRPNAGSYMEPKSLSQAIALIDKACKDPRVPRLLKGYFLDMYLSLREVKRVCRSGARVALVVGNAQYYGVPILVDELTAEIGEQAGLICEKIVVVRWRGNSAQQMGKYGRRPSRESVVIFHNSQ